MSSLSQKLTSLVTAFALVVVSFAAVTHHHDHAGHAGSSCSHDHAHTTCLAHSHSHGDVHSHDCGGEGSWQFAPFVPVDHQSSTQSDDVAATGDHHCLLCRFLSEHSAEISPTFGAEFQAWVSPLSVAITSDAPARLWTAYLQRGPPTA